MIKKLAIAMSLRNTDAGLFELASGMASATGAELVVVSIIRKKDVDGVGAVSCLGYPVTAQDYISKIFRQRMRNLQKIAGLLSFPENKFRPIIRVGDPVSEFMEIIRAETPDMIIVGESRGHTAEGLFRSSFTKAVLKRSPVSVAVVKNSFPAAIGQKREFTPEWGMP